MKIGVGNRDGHRQAVQNIGILARVALVPRASQKIMKSYLILSAYIEELQYRVHLKIQ